MKKNILAIALLSAISTTAMAENLYGAIDLGLTTAKDACTGLPSSVTGCKDTASLFRVAGGYQIDPTWAAEASYGSYGKASAGTGPVAGGGTLSADWQLSGLQVSGVGTFPLGNAFFLIGKLGIAQTTINAGSSLKCNA